MYYLKVIDNCATLTRLGMAGAAPQAMANSGMTGNTAQGSRAVPNDFTSVPMPSTADLQAMVAQVEPAPEPAVPDSPHPTDMMDIPVDTGLAINIIFIDMSINC